MLTTMSRKVSVVPVRENGALAATAMVSLLAPDPGT
jgi:hypothetical protein